MKRGDVFWAEQRGRRPVIVVSNDGFNMTAGWQSVIVVPVSTSEAQARRGPTAVPLSAGVAGLAKTSVALYSVSSDVDGVRIGQQMGLRSNRAKYCAWSS